MTLNQACWPMNGGPGYLPPKAIYSHKILTGFAKLSLMAQELQSNLLLNIKHTLLHYLEIPNT